MRKYLSTIIFSIVVIGVCVFAYMEYEKGDDEEGQKAKQEQLLGEVSVAQVTEVKVTAKETELLLKKENNQWKILKPIKSNADQEKVIAFVKSIVEEEANKIKLSGDAISWKKFGLDKPLATIEVHAGAVFTVEVGSKESFDGSFFVRKNKANEIHLGDNSWKTFAEKDANTLRDKKPFKGLGDVIDIQVSRDQGSEKAPFQLVKKDKAWQVLGGETLRLQQTNVNNFVRSIKEIEILDFASETKGKKELKKYLLNKPEITIALKTQGVPSKPWTLFVSKEKDNSVYLVSSNLESIYKINKPKLSPLDKELTDFRDKKYPFNFNVNTVSEVKFKIEQKDIHLKKENNKWSLVNDPKGQVESENVKKFVDAVQRLRVDRFLKGSSALTNANKYIELMDKKSNKVFKIEWGNEVKTKIGIKNHLVYAKSSLSEELLGMNKFSLVDLPYKAIFPVEDKKTEKDKSSSKL